MSRYFLWCFVAGAISAASAPPAGAADNLWTAAGVSNYDTAGNWSAARVPSFFDDDRAVVDNGGTAFLSAAASIEPGAVALGVTAAGVGTLEIRNGGSLSVLASNTNLGDVTVGVAGRGTLRVLPGGSLMASGALISGNNAANTIVLGGAAAGTATVSAASATFGGTTQVFKNAAFNTSVSGTPGNIALNGTSVYTPMIDAGVGGVALLDAGTAAVALGGTLRPTFSFAPAPGSTWNLFHGASITGGFAAIQPVGLSPGLRLTTSVTGAVGNQNLRLAVDQVLTLAINRDTSVASIVNAAAGSLSFDGYAIQSASGQLNRGAWNSLDDQNTLGGDWLESSGSNANRLAELKPTSAGTLAGAASVSLGAVYAPQASPPPFATPLSDDITFTYAKSDGAVVTGDVTYTGIKGINNLVLQVDPTDGRARVKNTSSYNVSIDGYSITSASGALSTAGWTSFDDQNIGDWLESTGASPSKLAELKPTSSTTFTGGVSTVSMGTIFNAAGTKDLVFQFLQVGQSAPTTGVVVYESFAAGNADFDGDGDVDGGDFIRWQRNLGATGAAATLANGNANGDGAINAADLAVWRDQFGNQRPSSAAAFVAVPEPKSFALLSVGLFAATVSTRRGARKE